MPRPVCLVLGCLAVLAACASAPTGAGASGWYAPVPALNATGGAVAHPAVAVDDAGNVYAAWTEGGRMEVSKRPVGDVWEQPQTLDPNVTSSANPDIGVDAAGNAVAVWRSGTGSTTIRQAHRPAAAASFGAPAPVPTPAGPSDNPALAVNRAGDAVLAVTTAAPLNHGVVSVFLGTSTGEFAATQSTPYDEGTNSIVYPPDVAINEAGDATVVWRATFDTPDVEIDAGYRPRSAGFGGVQNVATDAVVKFDPSAAIDSNGRAIAAWDEGNGGAIRAYLRGDGAGGTWTFVSDLDSPQSGSGDPDVTFDGMDTPVAAWNRAGQLRTSTRPSGAFLPSTSLSTPSEAPTDITLASDRVAGRVLLAWTGGGASPVVRASERLGDFGFGPPQTLSPDAHGGSAPDLAFDRQGNAAAVWIDTSPPGQNPHLVGAEFDRTPPRFVSTSLDLHPTAGEPATYSTSAVDDWSKPIFVWDLGDGGSAVAPKITHTYARPGVYHAAVGAYDFVVNSVSQEFTVTVAPAPTRGVDFNASEVSGKVLVSLRRGNGKYGPFRRLGPNDNVPIGSIIDATRGVSELNMAANRSASKRQRGRFSRGVFKVLQGKGSALTTAVLLGPGNFRKQCRTFGYLAKKKRRPHRRLFGNVRGRFRTRGRHSTATVRGTKWTMTDTCAGTLTLVTKGSVFVRDFGKRKTVVVTAGHRYLARSPKKR